MIHVNEEYILSSSLTTTSSLKKDSKSPASNDKIKFQKHIRHGWTFLNIQLYVPASKKNT